MIKKMSNSSVIDIYHDNGKPLIECLLSECQKGEEIMIIIVDAGKRAKTRLANLGIVPGAIIVKTKTAPFKGPVEILVKGTSLVIGRGIAGKIIVKCEGSCPL